MRSGRSLLIARGVGVRVAEWMGRGVMPLTDRGIVGAAF